MTDVALMSDLKKLVEKHSNNTVVRWVPICGQYEDSNYCSVLKERTLNNQIDGKNGTSRKAICWIKVTITKHSDAISDLKTELYQC